MLVSQSSEHPELTSNEYLSLNYLLIIYVVKVIQALNVSNAVVSMILNQMYRHPHSNMTFTMYNNLK